MKDLPYQQYESFLSEPTAASYRNLRRELMQRVRSPFSAEPIHKAAQLIEDQFYSEAKDLLESMLPAWLLSPRWHFLAEKIAVDGGDAASDHVERFQMYACLKGLMRTGDGSPSAPFVVTYETDVTDLLWALGLQPASSQFVRADTGYLQIVSCEKGRELWFDCSAFTNLATPIATLANSMATALDHHEAVQEAASRWN